MQLRWTDQHGPQTMTVADDQALATAARLVRQQVATAVEVGHTCTIMLAPARLTEEFRAQQLAEFERRYDQADRRMDQAEGRAAAATRRGDAAWAGCWRALAERLGERLGGIIAEAAEADRRARERVMTIPHD